MLALPSLLPSLRPRQRPRTHSVTSSASAAPLPPLARKTGVALRFNAVQQSQATAARRTRFSCSASAAPLDGAAVARYASLTALQVGVMVLAMAALDAALLPNLAPLQARCVVAAWFAFNSLRSRTFSFLPAPRPTLKGEQRDIDQKKRPAWMPPVLVFPLVWTIMAVLRTISSTMVFEALGGKLLAAPLVLFMTHLAVGDTWNHVNNVRKELGTAVPGVLCVWTSATAAVVAYHAVLPQAGFVLLPLSVWLSIAAALVFDIWRLNNTLGRYPLYPTQGVLYN